MNPASLPVAQSWPGPMPLRKPALGWPHDPAKLRSGPSRRWPHHPADRVAPCSCEKPLPGGPMILRTGNQADPSAGYPTTARLASGCWPGSAGWDWLPGYPQGRGEGSQVASTILFPGLRGAANRRTILILRPPPDPLTAPCRRGGAGESPTSPPVPCHGATRYTCAGRHVSTARTRNAPVLPIHLMRTIRCVSLYSPASNR